MKTIPLTQGKVAIVDDEDFDWLNQVKWFTKITGNGTQIYAARTKRIGGKATTIYMHRAIMAGDLDHVDLDGKEVDHDNRKTLDNRRENLKVCTKKENLSNRRYGKRFFKRS